MYRRPHAESERTSTMWKRTYLALAVLGLTLLAPGLASHLQADAGGGNRPFKGVAAGAITGIAPSGAIVVEYTGTATHLGKFTRTEYLFFGPEGTISGTITFKAANGD